MNYVKATFVNLFRSIHSVLQNYLLDSLCLNFSITTFPKNPEKSLLKSRIILCDVANKVQKKLKPFLSNIKYSPDIM